MHIIYVTRQWTHLSLVLAVRGVDELEGLVSGRGGQARVLQLQHRVAQRL